MDYRETHGPRIPGTDTAALDFALTFLAAWGLALWRYNVSIWMVALIVLSWALHAAFVPVDSMANKHI